MSDFLTPMHFSFVQDYSNVAKDQVQTMTVQMMMMNVGRNADDIY